VVYNRVNGGTVYFWSANGVGISNGKYISTVNADDNYFLIRARDNGVGQVEVGRVSGGVDPYVSFGGSQDHKFYNSGSVTWTIGAARRFLINATSTAHTDTSGVIDLNVTAGATGVVAFDTALTSISGGLTGETIYNINLNVYGNAGDDASSYIYGIHMTADGVGSAKKRALWVDGTNWEYGLYSEAPTYFGDDVTFAAGKVLDLATNAGVFKPRRVSQSAQPTPADNELLVWRDTDDDKTYLVYDDPDVGTRKVEMT